MNKKILLIFCIFCMLEIVVASNYVEDASSTSTIGSWSSSANTYDGDWSTYGGATAGDLATLTQTYNSVNDTSFVFWKIKTLNGIKIYDVSSYVISNTLIVRAESIRSSSPQRVVFYAYNGSDYIILGYDNTGYTIYEEGLIEGNSPAFIHYNFDNYLLNESIIIDEGYIKNGSLILSVNNGNLINSPIVSSDNVTLNGVNQYIDSYNPLLNQDNNFTFAVWVYPREDARQGLFGVRYRCDFDILLGGNVQFGVRNVTAQTVEAPITLNAWQLLVGVYNADESTIYIYKNDNLIDSELITQKFLCDGNIRLGWSGTVLGGAGTHFNGSVSNAIILNQALNLSQVQVLYNEGRLTKYSSFFNVNVAYMHNIGEYDSSYLYDSSNVFKSESNYQIQIFNSDYIETLNIIEPYSYCVWYNNSHYCYNGHYYINGQEVSSFVHPINYTLNYLNITQTGNYDELYLFDFIIDPINILSLYQDQSYGLNEDYTLFYLKHYFSNNSISEFTINWKNLDDDSTGSSSTNIGVIALNLSEAVTYSINVSSNYAYGFNSSFSGSIQEYTFYVYDKNTLIINLYDEESLNLISEDINFLYTINSNLYTDTIENGFWNLSNLSSGEYKLKFSNENYSTTYYYVTLQDGYSVVLNSYLLPLDYAELRSFNIKCNGQAVQDVLLTFNRLIDSSYVPVAQSISDQTGYSSVYLNPEIEYKGIFTHKIYGTYTLTFTPYNNPYTIEICSVTSDQPYNWSNMFDMFDYLISPESNLILRNQSLFSLDVSSPLGYIHNFGIYYNDSIQSNLTGSPNGGTVNITLDLSSYSGALDIYYYINATGENNFFDFHKIYYVQSYSEASNTTFWGVLQDLKSEGNAISQGWWFVVFTFLSIILMSLIAQYTNVDDLSLSMSGFFVYILGTLMGFYVWYILVPVGAVIFGYMLIVRR